MSNASEQSAVTPRTGKPFTFTRRRGSATAEFFPGAGSTLHFANRDVDTFTARSLPTGLLQSGDEVVIAYNGTTVFKGDVKAITDRHGRGDDRIQDVTVAGPWDKLQRLVFRQTWQRAVKGGSPITFSTSRVILGQLPTGAAQTMNAQVAEIVNYAATKCGVTLGANAAPLLYLPFDEARDITCADAIRRELRFFPKLIVRFNYASGTPALVVAAPSGSDAAYVATVHKTERVYQYDAHPVSCVDIAVDAFDVVVGGKSATFHQIYPPDGNPDSLDCLHITIPLAPGSASTTNESFKSVTEDFPNDLNDVDWWKEKHPRLANVAASAIRITDATRTPSRYPRIAKATKGEIEEAGLHCEVSRVTCKCKIETTDDEEDEIQLSMDFLTTDATTRTYTWQTGSESVDGETLPNGLAQALYEQRAGALASEQMTVRLGNSLPVIGDMADGLILQSYDIDLADLTARLVFGRPEHLSAEDMRSLLNGFRQRGYASTSRIRKEEADEDADEADAPGGIPPIASSEWAPGVKAKTTIKKAGANAGGGTVTMDTTGTGSAAGSAKVEVADSTGNRKFAFDTAEIPAECTSGKLGVHTLEFKDNKGTTHAYHLICCDDVDLKGLQPAPAASSINVTALTGTKTEDVITGISFAFDSNSHQLIATLTKKRVTVIDTAAISGNPPTAALPLFTLREAVVGSVYNPSDKTFKHVKAVFVTGEYQPTETTDSTPVFTAESHDTLYGGS